MSTEVAGKRSPAADLGVRPTRLSWRCRTRLPSSTLLRSLAPGPSVNSFLSPLHQPPRSSKATAPLTLTATSRSVRPVGLLQGAPCSHALPRCSARAPSSIFWRPNAATFDSSSTSSSTVSESSGRLKVARRLFDVMREQATQFPCFLSPEHSSHGGLKNWQPCRFSRLLKLSLTLSNVEPYLGVGFLTPRHAVRWDVLECSQVLLHP